MAQPQSLEAAEALLQQYFSSETLAKVLSPFPELPSKDDYRTAFNVRDQLANLFLGERPFFRKTTIPGHAQQRKDVDELCQWVRLYVTI